MTISTPPWNNARVIVCCGTGGVGKTNVAAALGLAAAHLGRRTVVMTIDPAPRLANVLGVTEQTTMVRQIDTEACKTHGLTLYAPLSVVLPNTKEIFDSLIETLAPNPRLKTQILENPIYQRLSTIIAGSHEYAALEQFYRLYDSKDYDLIVLDTPPAQNVLEFFTAPQRWLQFGDPRTIALISKFSGSKGLNPLFRFGQMAFEKAIAMMVGDSAMHQLMTLLTQLKEMVGPLTRRAKIVEEILQAQSTSVIWVTTPCLDPSHRLAHMQRALNTINRGKHWAVLNRFHPTLGFHFEDLQAMLEPYITRLSPSEQDDALYALEYAHAQAILSTRTLEYLNTNHTTRTIPELPATLDELARIISIAKMLLTSHNGRQP
jgi:anion-transporting  ArsA/GET3 family ATPase